MLTAGELLAALQTVHPLTPVMIELSGPGNDGTRGQLDPIVYTTRHSLTLSISADQWHAIAPLD